MAQKSILSFFKTSDRSAPKESEQQKIVKSDKASMKESLKRNDDESPVKKARSKRKIKAIESDDESSPAKITDGGLEDNKSRNEEKSNKSPKKISNRENEDVKINGTPRRPSKMKKLENEDKENSSESLDKMEIDSPASNKSTPSTSKSGTPSTSKIDTPSMSKVSTPTPSSTRLGNDQELTPRRKTARKTLISSKNTNTASNINKEKVDTKTEDAKPSTSKSATTNDETNNDGHGSNNVQKSENDTLKKPHGNTKSSKRINKNKKIKNDQEEIKDVRNDPTKNAEETDNKEPLKESFVGELGIDSQNSTKKNKAETNEIPENSDLTCNHDSDQNPKENEIIERSNSENNECSKKNLVSKKSDRSKRNSKKVLPERQKTKIEKSGDGQDSENELDNKDPKDKKNAEKQKTVNKAEDKEQSFSKKPEKRVVKVEIKTPKKSTPKRKTKTTSKEETPLKKSDVRNSIQSFFAPVKKSEEKIITNDSGDDKELDKAVKAQNKTTNEQDKAVKEQDSVIKIQEEGVKEQDGDENEQNGDVNEQEEDVEQVVEVKEQNGNLKVQEETVNEQEGAVKEQIDTERKILETDDSPVKKVAKTKKKLQTLESDEEEEEPKVVEPKIKKEINEAENKAETPSDETSAGSSTDKEELPPDYKKSPSKKEAEVNSISDVAKQSFGCKSTSSSTVYDPSKNRYHPIDDACWKKEEKVPYLALAKTLELIENTSGRLKTIEILSNFFRSVIVLSPGNLLQSVYLCLNRLAPEYEGIELGVGETLLMKAVAQATGRTLGQIKAEVAVKGDLGLVSESSRGNQRVMFAPPKLTVSSVFSKFLEIAKMTGNASMSKKTDKIQSLCVACRDCESKYIIRSLSGKLRIGLAEQSILAAIARAAVLTPPGQSYPPEVIDASKGMSENKFKEFCDSQALILKTAYCECSNYDLIIPVLLKEGISALPKCCQLEPGRPLKPMLAHPTDGIEKVLERFDKNAFTCEFKYDGERAQIHMTENGEVKIFSRNQEDTTSKYPDVISRITNALKESTKSFILDSEAVAWDKSLKQILPFQVLSTRKKKDAVASEIVVQVCIMAFDLLYLNGESLVKKPLKERRSLLHSSFSEVENEIMFAQYKDGNSAETMQEFLDESIKANCEGLMVKALETDASYEIAKRSHNWLKLKKDYLQGIGDTLDLVVIGGYYGKGKRTGNYGGFLLACYDEENEEFQSICKLGTGFKDDILESHTTFLKQHIIADSKSYYRYDHSLKPDEWFDAVQVWEIKCADLSISPVYKAAVGIVDPEKGISLRFPRFVRIRDDKTPENATNSAQIADMYHKQSQIQNTTNKNTKTDEDYY